MYNKIKEIMNEDNLKELLKGIDIKDKFTYSNPIFIDLKERTKQHNSIILNYQGNYEEDRYIRTFFICRCFSRSILYS